MTRSVLFIKNKYLKFSFEFAGVKKNMYLKDSFGTKPNYGNVNGMFWVLILNIKRHFC